MASPPTEGDRVIYDGDNSNWILISSGSANAAIAGVDASLPLKSDGNAVTPVLSIREARTETAATAAGDGEGPDGAVHCWPKQPTLLLPVALLIPVQWSQQTC